MSLPITYVLVALTAIMWGANFNLAKPVLAEMHPFMAGAGRYVIAALIMLILMLLRGERVPLRNARAYVVLGLVGVFGFNLFFFLGMTSTSPVNGALIMALNPLTTALFAYLVLGDKPSMRQILAFPVGIIGVCIVVLGAGAELHVARGDLFLMIANINWAFYNVLVRKLMPKDTSGIASTAGIMSVGALALTAAALMSGEAFVMPSVYAGSALLAMSVGGGVLAYLFWNAGIGVLGAARAAIFLNLVPVASMIIAACGGTPPTQVQLMGGALVIGAVTFSSLPMRKPA
ncbi:MAG TPA: DMT family transporter [Rhodocyclaceae bacterium]|jgi:drug/metabolite transporter (DMT)-like permease|nr:DMT family transporter [Rhodocyclaceae bacterium]